MKRLIALATVATMIACAVTNAQQVTAHTTVATQTTTTIAADPEGPPNCLFIGRVFGLDPYGDNNLSVRRRPYGPRGPVSEIDELFTNDQVCVAQIDGRWSFVQTRWATFTPPGVLAARSVATAPPQSTVAFATSDVSAARTRADILALGPEMTTTTNWADGAHNGSIAPWTDALGGIYSGGATSLNAAAHTMPFDAQLMLPASMNNPGPKQIDVFFTVPSGNNFIGVIFRSDGSGNFYTAYLDPNRGGLKIMALKPGFVVVAGYTAHWPPLTVGKSYCLRAGIEPSGGQSGVKLTAGIYNSCEGTSPTIGPQIGHDEVFFDVTPALQLAAQPTGGQDGIWASSSAGYKIQRIAVANVASSVRGVQGQVSLTGVNIAGGGFRPAIYATPAEIDYFLSKGMNIVRLAFHWELMQPNALANGVWTNQPIDTAELAKYDVGVDYATSKGMSVLVDPHSYASYKDSVTGLSVAMGTDGLPLTAMADFWGQLAAHYKGNPKYIFGLMNEPTRAITPAGWTTAANAAIAAIRATGATNKIFVPGWGGGNHLRELGPIIDSSNNWLFEFHKYFDVSSAGIDYHCGSEVIGLNRLMPVTYWAREQGVKLFLGEFGAGSNTTCMNCLDNVLKFMNDNSDVWYGWTYWAAGPWPRRYTFSVEPDAPLPPGTDRAQMSVLDRYVAGPPP